MTTIQAQGRLLTATADNRLLRYLLLPYGEAGRTSAGTVTASAGSVAVPERIVANLEHDRTRPVAHSVHIEETDEGLIAEFRVAGTTAGNDLLVEASEGLRTGISVEIENPVIRKGALLAGDLTGAGFVTTPAFPSAQLMTAADVGELPADAVDNLRDFLTSALDVLDTASQGDPTDTAEPTSDPDAAEASASPVPVTLAASAASTPKSEATAEDATPTGSETTVTNAVVPADLLAASKNGAGSNSDKDLSLRNFYGLVASAHGSGNPSALTAALADVPQDIFDDARQPQFLGELWDGRQAPTFYTGLVEQSTLTGRKAVGWKFSEKPTVADWDGFPNEIHSSDVAIEAVETTAQRMAGGARFDRELIDFGETAFIDAYFRFAVEDYAQKIDSKVINFINSSSTPVTAAAGPSGTDVASVKIIDGVLNLLGQNVVPTFAVVGSDLYRNYLLTPKDKTLEYFAGQAGLEGGSLTGLTVVPSTLPALQGKVIVGAREAVTLFQLPGSPVRADALDIAHGGVEGAIYGYFALLFKGKGIVKL